MNDFTTELERRLAEIREQGLHRELRRVDSPQSARVVLDGKTLLNFSSNDYLGLADHPALKEAAVKAVEKFGAGSGASRLICGSLAPHHELEAALAAFKQTEAALSFSSGYAAALGTICAVVGKDDILILDKLVHASIVDAARLSGAKLRIFAHNDLNELEDILRWAAQRPPAENGRRSRALIVTESVFSMDGDLAPLREIVALKEKHSAWLMVDEAHATGLFGPNRRGLAEELGVSDKIEIQMGTLGKALGAGGGYICGSRVLIDYLVNRARSFIFSTAPVPAAAAAATAGVKLVQSAEGQKRLDQLWMLVEQLNTDLRAERGSVSRSAINRPGVVGTPEPVRQSGLLRVSDPRSAPSEQRAGSPSPGVSSAIIPLIIGAEAAAVEAARKLREQGCFVPAIRYPTVARGSARLRITLTAAHSSDDVQALAASLSQIVNRKS